MKQKFKIGDLVRVNDKTHDPALPENRLGLIVKRLDEHSRRNAHAPHTHIWVVMLTSGKSLNFHEMFLEHAPKENENEEEEK